jgi:VIT1/CCC1 family predicted Fe2+/Mn2+ transporter
MIDTVIASLILLLSLITRWFDSSKLKEILYMIRWWLMAILVCYILLGYD